MKTKNSVSLSELFCMRHFIKWTVFQIFWKRPRSIGTYYIVQCISLAIALDFTTCEFLKFSNKLPTLRMRLLNLGLWICVKNTWNSFMWRKQIIHFYCDKLLSNRRMETFLFTFILLHPTANTCSIFVQKKCLI